MISERNLQIYLLGMLRLNFRDWLIAHIPNEVNRGGRRGMLEAARKREMGVVKGYPDIVIHRPGGVSLFVEMKAAKGRVSEAQKEVHERLRALGNEVVVVKTHEEADDLVRRLGGRYGPKA